MTFDIRTLQVFFPSNVSWLARIAIGLMSNLVARGTSRLSQSPKVQDGSNAHAQEICFTDVVNYNRDVAFR
jgi:hypothetical protein